MGVAVEILFLASLEAEIPLGLVNPSPFNTNVTKITFNIWELITAMFTLGFILSELTVSTIVPVSKDKLDACHSSNYRSIALCSIIGKLIGLVLFHTLADKLLSSDLQFGFKEGHSTSMWTQMLKETVAYYTSNSCPVYFIMLDASKAFDRVSFAKLFLETSWSKCFVFSNSVVTSTLL